MFDKLVLDNLNNIKEELKKPYIKLDNALETKFAEELRDELLHTEIWKEQGDKTMSEKNTQRVLDSFKYSRKGITLGESGNPEKLLQLYNYLNSSEVLEWMSYVSGRRCDYFEGSAAIFRPGDHISKHNDLFTRKTADGKIQSRALTLNYWLAKDWLPEWGGRLIWEKPYAEIMPDFNTLALFTPSQLSQHWVEKVAENVTVPRLSITGWFMTDRTRNKHKFNLNLDY